MNLLATIAILISIESGGQRNPATCIGDNGKAVGILQIHAIVVKDVNQRYGTRYQWPADCKSPEKSKDIAVKYLTMYGKGKTPEQLARIWNGGPEGDHSTSTTDYLKKFRERTKGRSQ